MTFDAIETSAYDGHKVELYTFTGTISSFRLTSYVRDYVFTGQTYTSTPGLKRNTVKKTSSGGSQSGEVEITIPFDHPMATQYAFSDVPPDLAVIIQQGHASDVDQAFQTIWQGAITTFTVRERLAKLTCPSAFSLVLGNTIPSRRWQGPCNHLLYDERCGVSRNSFDLNVEVESFTGLTITMVSLAWSGTEGDGGEAINDRTGERRSIQSHTDDIITIKLPFTDLVIGDTLTLFQGCDHSADTCNNKFSNLDNYGGFNLVPSLNPFTQSQLR